MTNFDPIDVHMLYEYPLKSYPLIANPYVASLPVEWVKNSANLDRGTALAYWEKATAHLNQGKDIKYEEMIGTFYVQFRTL